MSTYIYFHDHWQILGLMVAMYSYINKIKNNEHMIHFHYS